MSKEEILEICKTCSNRKLNVHTGLVCSLTDKFGDFVDKCNDYKVDHAEFANQRERIKEIKLAEFGRKKTMKVFLGMIIISLIVILFSHMTFKPLNFKEIFKETFRLGLQIGIFYGIYNGKKWAKTVFTVLCVIGVLTGFIGMIYILKVSMIGLILIPLIWAYAYAIYFFNADEDFLNFFEYQKKYN